MVDTDEEVGTISPRGEAGILLSEARSSLVRNMIKRAGFGLSEEMEARFNLAGDRPFGEAFADDDGGRLTGQVLDHLLESEYPSFDDEDEEAIGDSPVFEGGEMPVQTSMFVVAPEMDEHAHAVETAVVGMASQVLDKGAIGEFSAKMKIKRESLTQAGQIIEEVWSIQVTARPAPPKK